MEDIGIDEIAGRGSDAAHTGELATMKQMFTLVLVAAAIVVVYAASSLANGSSAIQGLVVDSKQNRPLASASVSAFPANNNKLAGTARSGRDGSFRIAGLAAGNYRLFISKPGFRSVEVSGLTVAENDRMIIGFPIALQVSSAGTEDPLELIARCNNLVDPAQTSDVYIICGGL